MIMALIVQDEKVVLFLVFHKMYCMISHSNHTSMKMNTC